MTIINRPMDAGFFDLKLAVFLEWMGKSKKVLDLGCYDGRHSKLFLKGNNDVYGVEILKKPAEVARKKGIKVKVLDLDRSKTWPFEDSFFDIVVAGDIVEHVLSTDNFFANIHRILKKDGYLLISTPNIASLGRRVMLLAGKNPYIEICSHDEVQGFPAIGHVRYFTHDSLKRLLTHYGMVVEKTATPPLYLGPFTNSLLGRLFPTLTWSIILKARKL